MFTRRYVSSTSVLWRSQVRHPLAAVVVRPLVRARDDVHRRHSALPPGIWRESLLETVIPERAEKWYACRSPLPVPLSVPWIAPKHLVGRAPLLVG
jgi:hypothetical protein